MAINSWASPDDVRGVVSGVLETRGWTDPKVEPHIRLAEAVILSRLVLYYDVSQLREWQQDGVNAPDVLVTASAYLAGAFLLRVALVMNEQMSREDIQVIEEIAEKVVAQLCTGEGYIVDENGDTFEPEVAVEIPAGPAGNRFFPREVEKGDTTGRPFKEKF